MPEPKEWEVFEINSAQVSKRVELYAGVGIAYISFQGLWGTNLWAVICLGSVVTLQLVRYVVGAEYVRFCLNRGRNPNYGKARWSKYMVWSFSGPAFFGLGFLDLPLFPAESGVLGFRRKLGASCDVWGVWQGGCLEPEILDGLNGFYQFVET